jgi:hypothetical protein
MDFHEKKKKKKLVHTSAPTHVKAQLYPSKYMEYDHFRLEMSPFVHFIVQILFHKSNGVQSVLSFKILNKVAVCILLYMRYLI